MICCACLLLEACDKAEVPSIYSGPDGINFYYDQAGPYDADPYPNSDKTGHLVLGQGSRFIRTNNGCSTHRFASMHFANEVIGF